MDFLPFWQNLEHHGAAVALIDEGRSRHITYRALADTIRANHDDVGGPERKLVFLAIESSIDGVLLYLSLLSAGHVVCLCGKSIDPRLQARYRPDLIFIPGQDIAVPPGYVADGQICGHSRFSAIGEAAVLHDALCLLLTTSGSTGSPKLVRLSHDNVGAAAWQVRNALNLQPVDRTITALPLDHVLGLSVLHSHLCAGASIVLTKRRIMEKAFWHAFHDKAVTTLTGVPWTFKLMRDIALGPEDFPSLRNLAQSGAKLSGDIRDWLLARFPPDRVALYFMYGQTEAAGRICILPPELSHSKPDSVGRPVQGGGLSLTDGEIVYRGPNVMMGYAESRDDLRKPNLLEGVLATGDIGEIDGDGCLYLTGRRSRICKVLGTRINLDEVEDVLSRFGPLAASSDDEVITIWFELALKEHIASRGAAIAHLLGVPRDVVLLRAIRELPRLPSGKVAYERLK